MMTEAALSTRATALGPVPAKLHEQAARVNDCITKLDGLRQRLGLKMNTPGNGALPPTLGVKSGDDGLLTRIDDAGQRLASVITELERQVEALLELA